MPFTHTLTTASTALNIATTTAVQAVPFSHGTNAVTGDHQLGDQVATIDVVSTSSSETGMLVMFLYDPSTGVKLRVKQYQLSVPGNAYQANAAGNGGGYVCSVASTDDLSNKIDLLGLDDRTRAVSATGEVSPPNAQQLQWYVGAYSMTGTSWTVNITPTKCP